MCFKRCFCLLLYSSQSQSGGILGKLPAQQAGSQTSGSWWTSALSIMVPGSFRRATVASSWSGMCSGRLSLEQANCLREPKSFLFARYGSIWNLPMWSLTIRRAAQGRRWGEKRKVPSTLKRRGLRRSPQLWEPSAKKCLSAGVAATSLGTCSGGGNSKETRNRCVSAHYAIYLQGCSTDTLNPLRSSTSGSGFKRYPRHSPRKETQREEGFRCYGTSR